MGFGRQAAASLSQGQSPRLAAKLLASLVRDGEIELVTSPAPATPHMRQILFVFSAADEPTVAAWRAMVAGARNETVFTITDWPERADQIRAIDEARCVVAVWSRGAARNPLLRELLPRLITAWSSDRLVLASLDDTELPTGFADLPTIALGRDAQAAAKLTAGVSSVCDPVSSDPNPPPSPLAMPLPELAPSARTIERRRARFPFVAAGMLLIGLAIGLAASLVQVGRNQPTPAPTGGGSVPSPPPAAPGPRAPGSDLSLVLALLGLASGLGIGAGAAIVWVRRRSAQATRPPAVTSPPAASHDRDCRAPPASGPQIFVSYSRKNEVAVDRLVGEIEQLGYPVWIDRQTRGADRYALQIVSAIRNSDLVALMCSREAFASHHVTREVYVAGDCSKPFIVFQLDRDDVPDELLYFLSGFPRIAVESADPERLRAEIARLIPI